jgi:hypothetical protein
MGEIEDEMTVRQSFPEKKNSEPLLNSLPGEVSNLFGPFQHLPKCQRTTEHAK